MSQLDKTRIDKAVRSLEDYMISEGYRGYDPYDGLMSPIFRLPVIGSNKLVRFVFQQAFKRIPVNIRPALGIRKGLNPVTLGLSVQAYTYLSDVFKSSSSHYADQINHCLDRLEKLRSPGYSSYCWGYDFDWEARYSKMPAFTPTVVATGIIENALYEYFCRFNDTRAKDLILSAAEFVSQDLNRTTEGSTFCFSYSPHDREIVYNATMKGARILSHAFALSSNNAYLENARKTVEFVINHQNADGSWFYSLGDDRQWVDNFHTAYVLDCLRAYCDVIDDRTACQALERGFEFYANNFFTPDGVPKYYKDSIFPIDSTAIGQSILTLTHFGLVNLASDVVTWALQNMQAEEGYFYYFKGRLFVNKIPYMRWSNAWMLAGLSSYLLHAAELG